MTELDNVLRRCPACKAPGTDGISYEFYSGLNYQNKLFLLDAFNYILSDCVIPEQWCNLKMFLLHKNVENYRGISLLNCMVKLFTSLLADRLSKWTDDTEQIIPENQSGFRPGRSCVDNQFVLVSLIHLNIRIPATFSSSVLSTLNMRSTLSITLYSGRRCYGLDVQTESLTCSCHCIRKRL